MPRKRCLVPRVWAYSDIGKVRTTQEDAFFASTGLSAVADGMGGMQDGALAAQLAIGVMTRAADLISSTGDLDIAMRNADRTVYQRIFGFGGSTLISAWFHTPRVTIGNIGDSRAYWFKKRRRSLIQISRDHSSGRHTLTNTVGSGTAYVEMFTIEPERGDLILLCSDGLIDQVKDYEIADLLLEPTRNPARTLVKHVLEHTGARDNVTVVINRV